MFELELENESGKIVNINDGVDYEVISVSGLNPPPALIFTAKSPNRKGAKYNGSTLDVRNIVITIKLLGDVEENRNALYDWVDTEQYIKIRYRNGLKNVYCEGHVEDCDIDLFTDNETVALAVLCEDPFWKDMREVAVDIQTVLKQFLFPFAIDTAGVPLSTIRDSNATSIFNSGAETGVRITVKSNGTVKNLQIYDEADTTKRFSLNLTLEKNWIVEIDSENSPKTCRLFKPDGTVENILRHVGNNPTWFTLKKGNNRFGYLAESGTAEAEVTFGFTAKYKGV